MRLLNRTTSAFNAAGVVGDNQTLRMGYQRKYRLSAQNKIYIKLLFQFWNAEYIGQNAGNDTLTGTNDQLRFFDL